MSDVNKKYKDTLFNFIFREKEHFLDLYEICSGQRLNAEDITCFDLNSDIVNRERYNDVSFLTNDNRLIFLVEHQSTVNANLAIKLGIYYFALLQLWMTLYNKVKEIHSETEMQVPKPELYVVYNGKAQYIKKFETFDCGQFLQIKVPIVNIRYDELKNKNADNYLAGYAYFQYEYERKIEEGIPTLDAFTSTVEQCKANKYLKGIIEKEDFIAMFSDILSYDSQLIAKGEAKGEEKGKAKGKAELSMEIAHKAFAGQNQGNDASTIIKMLKDFGIPDSIIESAYEEVSNQTIKN